MASSVLKMLAQKAKKRLSTAGQAISKNESEKKTTAYLSQGGYMVVANKQSLEEDPLFEKVKKLMEKPDVLNPLAELTDYEIFNNLSSLDKEKYIIDISKRYNEIRNHLLNAKAN